MKAHHCLCDGLGFSTIFLSVSDQAKVENIPTLKPLTTCQKILRTIFLPFSFIKMQMYMTFVCKDYNCIKNR